MLLPWLSADFLKLHHVKPHGVFYAMMNADIELAKAVFSAVPKGVQVFVVRLEISSMG